LIEHEFERAERGQVSEEEAKNRTLEALTEMRYLGSEYFFVIDREPRMVAHPHQKELIGRYVGDNTDPAGVPLFREMVEVAQRNGEGIVEYRWPKVNGAEPAPKISYVRAFGPWGWIVGSGLYI